MMLRRVNDNAMLNLNPLNSYKKKKGQEKLKLLEQNDLTGAPRHFSSFSSFSF